MSLNTHNQGCLLDWEDLTNDRDGFNETIYHAFRDNKFTYIKNAPILDLKADAERGAKTGFFETREELKYQFKITGKKHKGFVPFESGGFQEYYYLDRDINNILDTSYMGDINKECTDHAAALMLGYQCFVRPAVSFYKASQKMGEEMILAIERGAEVKSGALTLETLESNHVLEFSRYKDETINYVRMKFCYGVDGPASRNPLIQLVELSKSALWPPVHDDTPFEEAKDDIGRTIYLCCLNTKALKEKLGIV